MNFIELARGMLEEAELYADEICGNCYCNLREEPCETCWSLGMAIGGLQIALEAK